MGHVLEGKTGTAKYGIAIAGEFVDEPDSFDFIGPYDHKQFGVMTGISAEVWVEVTWHRDKGQTDTPQTQRILIP